MSTRVLSLQKITKTCQWASLSVLSGVTFLLVGGHTGHKIFQNTTYKHTIVSPLIGLLSICFIASSYSFHYIDVQYLSTNFVFFVCLQSLLCKWRSSFGIVLSERKFVEIAGMALLLDQVVEVIAKPPARRTEADVTAVCTFLREKSELLSKTDSGTGRVSKKIKLMNG